MSEASIPLVRLDPASQPEPQLPESAEFHYEQYVVPLRYETARRLGFEPGERMARRVAVLSTDSLPVLCSTSYLPVELVSDSNGSDGTKAWQRVELGRLALVGYKLTLAGSAKMYGRLPTTIERSVLHIPASAEMPVFLYYRPYYVHGIQPDPLRAGVVIRFRTDRIIWEIGHDYSGLLLVPELASWRSATSTLATPLEDS